MVPKSDRVAATEVKERLFASLLAPSLQVKGALFPVTRRIAVQYSDSNGRKKVSVVQGEVLPMREMSRECRHLSIHCAKRGRRRITPLCDPWHLNDSSKNAALLESAQVWWTDKVGNDLLTCSMGAASTRLSMSTSRES